MSEDGEDRRQAGEDDFLVFFRMGGVMNLADSMQLSADEVKAALSAREKYDAAQAVLLARAIRDPEAVYAVVDGGKAQRQSLVDQVAGRLAAALAAKRMPASWGDL